MKVCSVEEMRFLDNTIVEKYGISEKILMENAGNAVFSVISKFDVKNSKFLIICGVGNNGGDGLVVARKIYSNCGKVKVIILGDESKFKGAAKDNFEIVSKLGIEVCKTKNIEEITKELEKCDIVVDAIFGTGLTRNVEGFYKEVIDLINQSKKLIFSIDIPSGINGDNGKVMGAAIRANYTITLGLPKLGNILYPGYEYCGNLYVSHISFPPSVYENIKVQINDPVKIPKRKENGHKGDFGDVLFVVGAEGYYGAPYFSAMSFLKSGGGYSRLAAPKSVVSVIASRGNEVVFIPLEETEAGSIASKNTDRILELSQKTDMVVIGPGLSLNEETQCLAAELVQKISKPLIIDGDGLTAISKNLSVIKNRKAQTILTPHLGELARIVGKTVQEIEENKIRILKDISKKLNSIIVLKGAHSLIAFPDSTIYINLSGNSGMATAGSGDVLTGVIAAMFGLGLSINDSARMGVFIHGLSGDLAAIDKGKDGITAQDIMDYLPLAMKYIREDFEQISQKYMIESI